MFARVDVTVNIPTLLQKKEIKLVEIHFSEIEKFLVKEFVLRG